MKKIISIVLSLSLIMAIMIGCSNDKAETPSNVSSTDNTSSVSLPLSEKSVKFSFLSGAGGWSTELTLNADGTFSGEYSDSELGSFGDDYPNGTYYVCSFSGRFTDIQKNDEYSYKMTLENIDTEKTIGEEWIKDGIKYIATTPYGLEGGKDFIFYLPDTPIDTLSEEFLSWWPYNFEQKTNPKTTLSCYGILNVATEEGFFSVQ